MTEQIINGQFAKDNTGKIITLDDTNTVIEQIKLALTIPKGNFELNTELGSSIYDLDLNSVNDDVVFSMVCQLLLPFTNVEVSKASILSNDNSHLYLSLELNINNTDFTIDIYN